MRTVPSSIAAASQGGTTRFCRCWTLTRRDGEVLGFTDHDRDLVIGGTAFEAASGLDRTAIESAEGLAATGGELSGALTSARILPEEIALGLYDGAELRCWLVDWSQPALDFLLEASELGEIRQTDGRFTAETRNALAALDAEQGRRYGLSCSAELGDAACGVDLAMSARRCVTTLGSIAGGVRITAAALAGFQSGFFTRGRLEFTSGVNAGLVVGVREHAAGVITLWQSLARLPAAGDQIIVTAGCDKSLAMCRGKFGNALNFRGFPFIPAPEFTLTYAQPGEGRHQGRPLVV